MGLKQKLSVSLAVLLILLHGFPVFAVAAGELRAESEAAVSQNSGAASGQTETPPAPTETPDALPDADNAPENGGNLDEPAIPENSGCPEDAEGLQPPSGTQPPETPPAESEGQGEIPMFTVDVVESGEQPGLYGTLSHIPENAVYIGVEYSFGGESYYFLEDSLWTLNEEFPNQSPLTQLCMALNARPYTVWQNGTVNSLYIRLVITCYDSEDIQTEPILFSNQTTYPIPETPPPFTAETVYLAGGYQVNGHFEDFPPDVVRLRPVYSLDGLEYKGVNELDPNDWWLDLLGAEDEEERYYLENQTCINYYEEPLVSYVDGKLDRFFLALEVTTESGVYLTATAVMERGAAEPIPEGVRVKAAVPFTMRPLDEWGNPLDVTYGQYQLTARAGTAADQAARLLPDTLPLEVQLWAEDSPEMLTSGIVQVPVTWKTLSALELTAGTQVILPDAAGALIVPAGTELATPLGNYLLSEPVTFDGDGQVNLVIDAVGKDEAPDVSLQENSYENSLEHIGALSLAFRLKPSGATEIKAYTFVEGDEDWTELCDLLARRDLNYNQAMGIYGFVPLLQPENAPFSDYLETGAPFVIGLKIVGGTFDGETVVLPWPGEYTPPAGIPDPGGSEGNENNVGTGGGDSTEEGQRPGLPQEPELPPMASPPAEVVTQAPEPMIPLGLPEAGVPEPPQTEDGDGEGTAHGEGLAVVRPVPSRLPHTGGDSPAVSIPTDQPAQSPPPEQTPPPQPRHTSAPTPSAQEKEPDAGQRPDNEPEGERDRSPLPVAAIALVGGGVAVSVGMGAASGTASGGGIFGKLLQSLRNLFLK